MSDVDCGKLDNTVKESRKERKRRWWLKLDYYHLWTKMRWRQIRNISNHKSFSPGWNPRMLVGHSLESTQAITRLIETILYNTLVIELQKEFWNAPLLPCSTALDDRRMKKQTDFLKAIIFLLCLLSDTNKYLCFLKIRNLCFVNLIKEVRPAICFGHSVLQSLWGLEQVL